AAVMTVGGWDDKEGFFGALGAFQSIEKKKPGIFKVLGVGPWGQGWLGRPDGDWVGPALFLGKTRVYSARHFVLPVFNYFLKDKGDISQIKEVNGFDTGTYDWREYANWSPSSSTDTALYLLDNGQLKFGDGTSGKRPTGGTKLYDEYASDPWNPVPYTQ